MTPAERFHPVNGIKALARRRIKLHIYDGVAIAAMPEGSGT